MVEQRNLMPSNAFAGKTTSPEIADLLAELSAQIDSVRRTFDRSLTSDATMANNGAVDDVVFIDDLAHCMECSWAKRGDTDMQLAPDIVAQCSRLLESALRLLKQIERMQAANAEAPAS